MTGLPTVDPSSPHEDKPAVDPSSPHEDKPAVDPSSPHEDKPAVDPSSPHEDKPAVDPSSPHEDKPAVDPSSPHEDKPAVDPSSPHEDKPAVDPSSPHEDKPAVDPSSPHEDKPAVDPSSPHEDKPAVDPSSPHEDKPAVDPSSPHEDKPASQDIAPRRSTQDPDEGYPSTPSDSENEETGSAMKPPLLPSPLTSDNNEVVANCCRPGFWGGFRFHPYLRTIRGCDDQVMEARKADFLQLLHEATPRMNLQEFDLTADDSQLEAKVLVNELPCSYISWEEPFYRMALQRELEMAGYEFMLDIPDELWQEDWIHNYNLQMNVMKLVVMAKETQWETEEFVSQILASNNRLEESKFEWVLPQGKEIVGSEFLDTLDQLRREVWIKSYNAQMNVLKLTAMAVNSQWETEEFVNQLLDSNNSYTQDDQRPVSMVIGGYPDVTSAIASQGQIGTTFISLVYPETRNFPLSGPQVEYLPAAGPEVVQVQTFDAPVDALNSLSGIRSSSVPAQEDRQRHHDLTLYRHLYVSPA